MKIAISGAGIAGPTLAFWLLKAGHEPTLIEAAPRLRTGGYMIDFWGLGFAVAERMSLADDVRSAGYPLEDVRWLDSAGRTAARISANTMQRELGDRFTSLPRGALAAILFRSVETRVETLFGVTVSAIEQAAEHVEITFSDGSRRDFDLLVGADGLHSAVRSVAFGPEQAFERDLGYVVAAFEAEGYRPRDELSYVSYGLPGRQISRFALRGDRTMFLFVFAAERLAGRPIASLEDRRRVIGQVFAGVGPEWPSIAERVGEASDLYFDRVSQILAPTWSKGRVALVGDAAACISLVAGEGTGLAMVEAYVLAGELSHSDDCQAALTRYEARLRPFIGGKQAAARRFASAFVPRTAIGLWLRNQAANLMAIPGLPGLMVGAQMRDDFALPDYAWAAPAGEVRKHVEVSVGTP